MISKWTIILFSFDNYNLMWVRMRTLINFPISLSIGFLLNYTSFQLKETLLRNIHFFFDQLLSTSCYLFMSNKSGNRLKHWWIDLRELQLLRLAGLYVETFIYWWQFHLLNAVIVQGGLGREDWGVGVRVVGAGVLGRHLIGEVV